MARRLYQVRVDIYESATRYEYPVVTHLFHGRTKEEAWKIHASHRESDSFLRECEDKGVFKGRVHCRAQISEGWR